MTPTDIIILSAGGMFTIILSLIGFIIMMFVKRLGDVREELKSIVKELRLTNSSLATIDKDLRDKIHEVDRRVIQIETEHRRRSTNGFQNNDGLEVHIDRLDQAIHDRDYAVGVARRNVTREEDTAGKSLTLYLSIAALVASLISIVIVLLRTKGA